MKTSFTIESVSDDMQVRVRSSEYGFSADVARSVDEIWSDAVVSNPGLFDGKIICLDKIENNELECFLVPYRYFFAQRADDRLQRSLNLQVLAVTGLIHHDDRVLFGVRKDDVHQYPKFIELVPSGGLDAQALKKDGTVDYKLHLLEEFEQELGASRALIEKVEPLFLCYDKYAWTFDIVCKLHVTDASFIEVSEHLPASEYSTLLSVRVCELPGFIKENEAIVVPSTIEILKFSALL